MSEIRTMHKTTEYKFVFKFAVLKLFSFPQKEKAEIGWSDHHTNCAYGCVHFRFRSTWNVLIKICIYFASLEVTQTQGRI